MHDPQKVFAEEIPSYDLQINGGLYTIFRLLCDYDFKTVLDIGSGLGGHAELFKLFDKDVYSVDLHHDADYVGDFLDVEFKQKFDVFWCSHVLEHQRNIGLFLDKAFHCIKDNGILAISVPVHPRERLVSGHIAEACKIIFFTYAPLQCCCGFPL